MTYWNGKAWAEPGKGIVRLGEPSQHFYGPPERGGCVNCGRLPPKPGEPPTAYQGCVAHGGTHSDHPKLQQGWMAPVRRDE